jgi:UDPglucose 6-dehydrogenase
MKVCVVGTGYVGLTTGAVFADLGNNVICVDNIKEKIDSLNKGIMPIYEPGLEEMVHRNKKDNRLVFTTDVDNSIKKSEVIFIAVGTPPKANGETDLSQVESAAMAIAKNLDSYKVIVNKSTVPVGTGDFVRRIVETNRKKNVDFDVVSNPEFLKEGTAINDTLYPDRIVIGAPSQNVAMKLLELYAPLERPMIITDVYSAEIIKYASNAFLATKISFINAIANICEKAGANVTDVIKGVGSDARIGQSFLQAGLGYGGSCFPKDVESLVHTSVKFGEEFKLLKTVVEINKNRVPRFISRIRKALKTIKGKNIAIFGLAFKPNTDDLREAKSIEVIRLLLEEGAKIQAYDPIAIENCKKIYPKIKYFNTSYAAADGADAIVVITEWNEFKFLALEKLREVMRQPIIFDGRNILDPKRVKAAGFEYYSIGR